MYAKKIIPHILTPFADDTSCFIEGTDLSDMCIQLSTEMNKLSTWLKTNLSTYQKQIA